MAKKTFKFNSKFLVLPVLLTVLALVLAFTLPKKQKVESLEHESVVKNEIKAEGAIEISSGELNHRQTADETIENGVYINHKYRFKFEYDENILNQEIYDYPYFVVSIPQSKSHSEVSRNQYSRCKSYMISENFKDGLLVSGTGIKIADSEMGCAYSFTPEGIDGTEPSWGITGYFKTEGEVVAVVLFVNNSEGIEKYKDKFSEIFNSFEILD